MFLFSSGGCNSLSQKIRIDVEQPTAGTKRVKATITQTLTKNLAFYLINGVPVFNPKKPIEDLRKKSSTAQS